MSALSARSPICAGTAARLSARIAPHPLASPRRSQADRKQRAPVVVRASSAAGERRGSDVSAGEWLSAFTDRPWDAPVQPWPAFLAVKGAKGFAQGFMLQDYAAPIEILNNGVAFSLPSSPKDAARRLLCNAVYFRQNYAVVGAACLLLSAFPRPYELLFLASAAVAVVSVSSRLFDRLWVAFNKERVFKYLPFETPRKLTGELVGGEKSIFGVPRVIFQMAGLIGTAFALSKTYSTLAGLTIAALLYFVPTVFLHAFLRPIDLFGGGSWTELLNSAKRRAVLKSLGRAAAANN